MTIRIEIDRDKCVGSGNCVFWAPGTFDLDDDGHVGGHRPGRRPRGPHPGGRRGVPGQGHPVVAAGARRRRGPKTTEEGDRMPIAITDEHEEQRRSVRRWLDAHCPPSVPRALLDAEVEELQPVWKEMAAQGWLGIHLPEEFGGEGFGLFELAVLLEETGRSLVPGPLLPTVATSALVAEAATAALAGLVPPGLIDGSTPATLSFGDAYLDVVDEGPTGSSWCRGPCGRCSGRPRPRWCWPRPEPIDGTVIWCLLDVPGSGGRVRTSELASLDPTRRVGRGGGGLGPGRRRAAARLPHHRAGPPGGGDPDGGGACRRGPLVSRDGHRVRQGAGPVRSAHRPVPGDQAPAGRHGHQGRADDRGGLGRGHGRRRRRPRTTPRWPRPPPAPSPSTGTPRGPRSACRCSGGIGFTWEHDVHLHLKRAMADRQLMGEPDAYCQEVATAAGGGARRALAADLPAEAEEIRAELAPVVAELAALDGDERRRRMVDAGLVMPHWPEALGPGRRCRRAGGHRRAAGRGRGQPPPHRHRGLGPARRSSPGVPPMQRERWVDATLMGDAALVPAVLRAGGGLRPGQPVHPGRAHRGGLVAHRAEGVDVDGPRRRLGDLPGPHRSVGAQAPGHHLLRRRHGLGRAGHPAVARAHRGGHVQRGVPRRRLRPRRLRDRRGQRRLGPGPADPGQRAGLDVLGIHLRHRGRVVAPPGRPVGATR